MSLHKCIWVCRCLYPPDIPKKTDNITWCVLDFKTALKWIWLDLSYTSESVESNLLSCICKQHWLPISSDIILPSSYYNIFFFKSCSSLVSTNKKKILPTHCYRMSFKWNKLLKQHAWWSVTTDSGVCHQCC